jgi:hypothetical protein
MTYFLVKEIFWEKKKNWREKVSLLSALFLAISPWHLQFSRAAFETNLSVTVVIFSVYFFLKAVRIQSAKLAGLSGLSFGLALFSYHSTRVLTPMLIVSLVIIFRRRISLKGFLLPFAAIYSIFFLLFIPILKSPDAQIRFRVTNALHVMENEDRASARILRDSSYEGGELSKVFFNRRLAILNYENIETVVHNYLLHFDPTYLFVSGDAPLHHPPEHGMLYFFDFALLILGVIFYIFQVRSRRNIILPIWLLAAPISSAVTIQVPHSVRTEVILPTLHIVSAIGLVGLLDLVKKESKVYSYLAILGFIPILMMSMGNYFYHYYVYTNNLISDKWLYGRDQAVDYTESVKGQYDKIIVSLSIDMPLNFWLFYSGKDPVSYLAQGGTRSGGFLYEENKYDNYEFRNFSYQEVQKASTRTLYAGTSKEFPPGVNGIKQILYKDGSLAIKIAPGENR